MAFNQSPPRLGNQFTTDRVLRSYLARALPKDVLSAIEPSLHTMGELAGGSLYELQLADRENEPVLTQWDPWGKRVDTIALSPLWKEAERISCELGVVAAAYDRAHGALSRVHQFSLVYLFDASSDVYTCPLAMTDGAAKSLTVHKHQALLDRAMPHLMSRTPANVWTSGQWMTEKIGGSDVGLSETVATPVGDGRYRLSGIKWFTSAATSQMALTLARPEGNPAGGRGLALFYVEMFNETGERNGVTIHRLKDKLGTRKVPTAELTLDGTLATPVAGLANGVRNITPMLNITRTWNTVAATAAMRRGIALARDYATRRVQFGAPLSDKPLHLDTLAGIEAEYEAAFHLAFRIVELLGREEAGELSESEARLLRLVTPLAKLTTGRQAVNVTSEAMEAFGGSGYIEDTGVARVARDAQVLPIWEGTTNVLSLDVLRALQKDGSFKDLMREVHDLIDPVKDSALARAGGVALRALNHAEAWLTAALAQGLPQVEAGARRFALTLGRSLELGLVVRHAAWSLAHERDGRSRAAALRFAAHGVDLILDELPADAAALANDVELPV
jgi:alkylation response protein AidB-like acyl-CoA dehydrogenase